MTSITDIAPPAERARVSIIERFIPALAFVLTALGGLLSASTLISLFDRLKNDETAGIETVMRGMVVVDQVGGIVLAVAAVFGTAGVVGCVVRMFSETKKASPPGVLYLIPALPSLISPAIMIHASRVVLDLLLDPVGKDFGKTGGDIAELCVIAFIISVVSIIISLIFPLVPFSSQTGRKLSPLMFVLLPTLIIVCLAATFFWMADDAWAHKGAKFPSNISAPR